MSCVDCLFVLRLSYAPLSNVINLLFGNSVQSKLQYLMAHGTQCNKQEASVNSWLATVATDCSICL